MKLDDLAHKKRTVSDLIRFIGNTAESIEVVNGIKSPNYSILLGAGASVTSGIRSGQHLINIWKNEVYQESNVKDKTLEEFFSSMNAPDWFEESNAYSALFENRYDLQRHRRMFVEHEVAGKTPSIGYAYLVKLIEKGFFNTVFTTNFDDLLNEAFYRFSKNRPIVCAHDSSISGITVTSARPKIIKLHGDYLFDDIKTTLRETESLETNMKMKFQEFAKDFGLIVVGYAGHDRSIMDILTYLLQQEDYFKNGIYWCIRKGDSNISAELKKLLWKDRVFFVEIDGFDELFAEINRKLNNGALPIDDAFLSRAHQETIIKELTENTLLNLSDSSSYLAEDCSKLKAHFEDNLANDFLKYIRDQKTEQSKTNKNTRTSKRLPFEELTLEDKRELNDLVTEAFGLGHSQIVLQKLQSKNIFALEDSRLKLELLELEAELLKDMKDDDVRKYFDELIRLNPSNERYYEIAANRSLDIKQALDYLAQASVKFCNDYYIINAYTLRLLNFCEEGIIQNDFQNLLEKINTNISQSLELFPYIDNLAYSYKARYFQLKYAHDIEKKQEEQEKLCKEVIEKYKYHPQTINILRLAKFSELNESYIKNALDFYSKADNEKDIEKITIELIQWYDSRHELEKAFDTFNEFETNYNSSDRYKYVKAKILMVNEYFEDALELFTSMPTDRDAVENIMTIMSYKNQFSELDKFYNTLKNKQDFFEHYLSVMGKHKELVEIYADKYSHNKLTMSELISYAYSLLKIGSYSDVVALLKPYFDNPQFCDAAIIVNYQFARLKIDPNSAKKIKEKIKEKIFEHKYINYSAFEKFGAACVVGDIKEIVSYLGKIVKEKPINKYIVQKWPVLEPFLKDPMIEQLLSPTIKHVKS